MPAKRQRREKPGQWEEIQGVWPHRVEGERAWQEVTRVGLALPEGKGEEAFGVLLRKENQGADNAEG